MDVATNQDQLRALDELLSSVRLAVQRPGFRRRLLEGLAASPTIGTLRVLRAVEQLGAGGPPSIGDVSGRLAVEHSTASRAVESAVRAGLLSRRPCDQDLRRSRLELTERGVAVLEQTSARRRELLGSITRDWSDTDVDRLVQLLGALSAGYDELERT